MLKQMVILFLLIIIFTGCSRLNNDKTPPMLKVSYCDVGQGDASLIEFPSGKVMLIDCGSEDSGIDTILTNRNIKHINDLVISHPHEDHYGNTRVLLDNFTISRVIFNKDDYSDSDSDFKKLFRYIVDTLKLDTIVPKTGRVISGYSDAVITTIWPDTNIHEFYLDDTVNAMSLVLQISFGDSRLLFTGDINFDSEREIANLKILSNIDILKVAHHGSRYATSTQFLKQTSPSIAVISVGKDNRYGHPTTEVLEKLNSFGIQIFRTDIQNTVVIRISREREIYTE